MAAFVRISLLLCLPLYSSSFITGSERLPYDNCKLAIGYDTSNDTVLLIGGQTYDRQFTMFKTNPNTFINRGSTFLTNDQKTYGHSQHYTQLNDLLWILRPDGEGFITMNTKTYAIQSPSITIPLNVGAGGCLTSIYNHLIVIGGEINTVALSYVQIYRLSDDQWLSNVPYLNRARTALTCVTLSNKVYAIGGFDALNIVLDTIDVLDLSNINIPSFTSWSSWNRLKKPRYAVRSAVYGTNIYVVGGFDSFNNACDDVDIMNTKTKSCIIDEPLSVALGYASCIVVENTLFVFGGGDSFLATLFYHDFYQYSMLPTSNPTSMPTNIPTTEYPTSHPTIDPTIHPTKNPIKDPTVDPTKSPTKDPTVDPTVHPTKNPMNSPTKDPTVDPTLFPTMDPSFSPSMLHTELLSSAPTYVQRDGKVREALSTVDASSQENTVMESALDNILTVVTLVAGAICIICCLLTFIGHRLYKQNENKKRMQNIENNMNDGYTEKNGEKRKYKHELKDANTVKMVKMNGPKRNDVIALADENTDNHDAIAQKDEDEEILEAVNSTIGGNQLIVGSASDNNDELELNAVPTVGRDDEFVIRSDSDEDDVISPGSIAAVGTLMANNSGESDVLKLDTFIKDGMDDNHEINEDGAKEVKSWLESIGFGRYYNVFVRNGFDSMEFLKEIDEVKDLDGIGISLSAHQLKIVNQIKKLK